MKSNRLQFATAALAFWIFAFPVLAEEKMSLLLRWDHQFQFAGYYAALWKGYYAEAGLDVTIQTPFKGKSGITDSVEAVVSGAADFAIGSADILVAHDKGKPVVAVGTIFHQSAARFFIRRDSGYANFSDLVRMRVARRVGDLLDTEFQAMLLAEGIDPNTVKPVASYGGEHHLADGSLDLIPGYSFVTPLLLKSKGVDYTSLKPQDYGIQFYGDTLFTREDLIRRNPEAVKKFIAATRRGWEYAIEHPVEIADLIAAKLTRRFPVADPVAFNRAQIEGVKDLTLYPLIEIGHMNPGRWRHMHKWLRRAGLVGRPLDIDRFIYDPAKREAQRQRFLHNLILAVSAIGAVISVVAWIWLLKRTVFARTAELEANHQELTETREKLYRQERLAMLRESEERYRAVVEDQTEMICRATPEGVLTFVNGAYCRDLGKAREEVIGQTFLPLVPEEDRARVLEGMTNIDPGETTPATEHRIVDPDGTVRWQEWTVRGLCDTEGRVEEIQAVGRDITTIRRTQEQLLQAQKMEAVGQLTGGVAHDFNNLLAVIIGNAELLKDRITDDGGLVQKIERAASRGANLTNRLLAFSRRQTLQMSVIDINAVIANMHELLQRTLGEAITIKIEECADLWNVKTDPAQLENAVLNLAINARHAMPKGGTLVIETANVSLEESDVASLDGCAPENYVELAVIDMGVGMSPDVRERAFEPFFTTKDVGEGSGLGLSMIYGFIKQSGGFAKIESELGQGCAVRLYLPRAMEQADGATAKDKGPKQRQRLGGTVLVVEDDLDVRDLAVTLLTNLGCATVEAEDGESALARLEEDTDINLLFTDVVLPQGMSGLDIAREARRRRPDIKIVFTSGYPDMDIEGLVWEGEKPGILGKPYSRAELAEALTTPMKAHPDPN